MTTTPNEPAEAPALDDGEDNPDLLVGDFLPDDDSHDVDLSELVDDPDPDAGDEGDE